MRADMARASPAFVATSGNGPYNRRPYDRAIGVPGHLRAGMVRRGIVGAGLRMRSVDALCKPVRGLYDQCLGSLG